MTHELKRPICVTLVAVAAWAGAGLASAATGMTRAEVESKYQQDRAACLSGQTIQSRETCLREAGAARDEGLRGRLTSDPGIEQRNALIRCEVLPAEDKELCRLRIQGAGTTSGSVAAGAIVRELVVIEPAPTPMPSPALPAIEMR